MLLEVQSEFSNKQALGAAVVVSQDVIDLGQYHVRSGYPADAPGGDANTASDLLHGGGTGANRRPGTLGQGYYQLNRKYGTPQIPFFCHVTSDITRGSGAITSFQVEFMTHTTATPGTTDGTLVTAVNLPIEGGDIKEGASIPWPSIPRFLTGRYFFLRYRQAGGSGTFAGNISAGFTVAMGTFGE